ncbi:hypothetical protein GN157_10220 [Flavobacterium rakeshii]|uniref:Periplasmic heavy metal sensor n=1 Tax=Flavobacterium rakeshii TaxID=1038845 RepID=A0A6N8HDB3_9FLAO|nr:hypothetical protein [Flavobacterium rakeshii]MUV04083.1 hypothetical protein [Flavobacterium rakeshii]
MKYFKLLVFAFLLLSGYESMAQYGYGSYYDPYYGSGYRPGVDRRIDTQRNKKSIRKKKDEKPKDLSVVMTEYLGEELKLDDFQKAAIKSIYDERKDEILALSHNEADTRDVLKDKFRIISDEIDKEILPLLSDEQKTAYQKMIDERNKS